MKRPFRDCVILFAVMLANLLLPLITARADDEAVSFFKSHANAIDVREAGDRLLIANKLIGLEFKKGDTGFQLTRLYGIKDGVDFLTQETRSGNGDLFRVIMTLDPKYVRRDDRNLTKIGGFNTIDEMAGESFAIGSHSGASSSWKKEEKPGEVTLRFSMNKADVREDKGALDAEVTVTLRDADPLSYWRINIKNGSGRYGIERVRFPILMFAPIGNADQNVLLYPRQRGELLERPFVQLNSEDFYPHNFNMQFNALYDKASGSGVYFGTYDSTPNLHVTEFFNRPTEIDWLPAHFPPNITFASEDYSLPYDCVVGPFKGDWFDAAQIYRAWALKQKWCGKGTLTRRADVPKWYKEAPLQLFTFLSDSAEGTHSQEKNLAIAADHFREFLKWTGMPLSANFYAWKESHPDLSSYNVPFNLYRMHTSGRWQGMLSENAHDGNYPRIPAISTFSDVCKQLRQEGGRVSPYIALEIIDQGASENAPYAAEAKPNITRDLYGALRTWGAETTWDPCACTPWWRQRLSETCTLMLQNEHVGGFYLDVMQGSSYPCYWTPHGHSAGGGSATTAGMHGLVEAIRDAVRAKDSDAILTGENTSENMIDVCDAALQQTLTERSKAPVFAAVYKDFVIRHGLEMSVGPGDDFFIECGSLFVEGSKIGMLRLRPRMGSLSFQKPEHAEMVKFLDRLVGYYRNDATRKFLSYGQLQRPLSFKAPAAMPMLSCKIGGEWPAIMSGAMRCEDGELGVFVVNVSDKEVSFEASMDRSQYGISSDTSVKIESIDSNAAVHPVQGSSTGPIELAGTLPPHDVILFKIMPAAK